MSRSPSTTTLRPPPEREIKGFVCGYRCDDGTHKNQPCDDNNAVTTTTTTKKTTTTMTTVATTTATAVTTTTAAVATAMTVRQ